MAPRRGGEQLGSCSNNAAFPYRAYRADLEKIVGYIAQNNLTAALAMWDEIEAQVERLRDFPHSGRIGRLPGTRELVVTRTSFLVVYRVEDNIELIRVLHGAQQSPPVDSE
ncbi:type II toxin-antitoxin system RelE/ParE family toxin [Rhizobium rhizogenes]|nr:type II toxin-antitoxin system RelE/ParE family toxin [Rhizobium rhizogenes]QRM39903.1 type II toxin-antitoxin system RelE/ParE family toxin [Rhizobium rhizogenes]